MDWMQSSVLLSVFLLMLARPVLSIRCFQCGSDQRLDKMSDVCGAYSHFDTERNVPVECYSEEANTPGIACVKIVKQGPRGFIWDGRWRTVIRRCTTISETGVLGYCNWGHDDNGVYWEECYCSSDGCNGTGKYRIAWSTLTASTILAILALYYSS